MMIRQLAILFGCLALGELVIYLTHIPLPSSILGMLLLTLLLKLKVIRLEWCAVFQISWWATSVSFSYRQEWLSCFISTLSRPNFCLL